MESSEAWRKPVIMRREWGCAFSAVIAEPMARLWQKCQDNNVFVFGDKHLNYSVGSISNRLERHLSIFTTVVRR